MDNFEVILFAIMFAILLMSRTMFMFAIILVSRIMFMFGMFTSRTVFMFGMFMFMSAHIHLVGNDSLSIN
jgi:hypothetical protein